MVLPVNLKAQSCKVRTFRPLTREFSGLGGRLGSKGQTQSEGKQSLLFQLCASNCGRKTGPGSKAIRLGYVRRR